MIRTLAVALILFAASAAPAYAQRAVIRGLDKVTGHASDYTLSIGRPARIGSLEVIARSCTKSAPEETPEVRIYVEVFDHPPVREGEESERREIFHGWLFASSPGLNAVDHPTYDIWAIDCRS
ncbi:MAG: DUF2155 domain-containing protein [Hyphomonadaceae bacterium]|nr:DUF2155 domain-containing protein [Hyphomonadaceae bacterium]GIK49567.1 MAG: hypothetical protein BroJett013_22640 [Alphaproteobacteria bacterium]